MKVDFASLERTHLGFPSEWKGKTQDGKDLTISYRYGRTKITVGEKVIATLSIDQFDVGGYMDDHVLESLLKNNGYL